MVEAASDYLLAQGFKAVVESNLNRDELEAITSAIEQNYDGLIIHADKVDSEPLNQLMQQHPTTVMLNRHLTKFKERCVDVDNTLGGRIAAQALVSQGHTCIAMVSGPVSYTDTEQRSAGFKRELRASGLELRSELAGSFVRLSGEESMEEIYHNHADVTGIFFHNDEMAIGALLACRRLGIRVPQDISIIGFDGLPMCEYVTPRLTSVEQPLLQLGEQAARIVCDLISGVEQSQRILGARYQPVLVERESVAAPPGHSQEQVSLTQRELECLTWTANGKTSWEIAVILGVSESTATFHLRNAGNKLKASNRAHAVAKAMHQGLIVMPSDD